MVTLALRGARRLGGGASEIGAASEHGRRAAHRPKPGGPPVRGSGRPRCPCAAPGSVATLGGSDREGTQLTWEQGKARASRVGKRCVRRDELRDVGPDLLVDQLDQLRAEAECAVEG